MHPNKAIIGNNPFNINNPFDAFTCSSKICFWGKTSFTFIPQNLSSHVGLKKVCVRHHGNIVARTGIISCRDVVSDWNTITTVLLLQTRRNGGVPLCFAVNVAVAGRTSKASLLESSYLPLVLCCLSDCLNNPKAAAFR